jgi:hypothetical protein
LKDFENAVQGCIDTLKLARNIIPKEEVGNYKQDDLVQKLIGEKYEETTNKIILSKNLLKRNIRPTIRWKTFF